MSVQNKTVVITGASQGIGEATARYLASQGAAVVLMARNKQKLAAITQEITNKGGNAWAIAGDVSRHHDVQALIKLAIDQTGRVDVLVNNAGTIEPIARLADSDVKDWSHVMDVNIKGVYYAIRESLPHMLTQQSGTVINISSGAAYGAMEGWSHYCTSKAAVLMLTQSVHKEYASQGIRSVGLSPGTVATAMQTAIKDSGINPVSQMAWEAHKPVEWVAKAVAFLCGAESDTFLGQDFSMKTAEGLKMIGVDYAK